MKSVKTTSTTLKNLWLKNLWLPLVVPFLIVMAGIVAAIRFLRLCGNWNDFLINLLTEMIGIALTVGYVEWIIDRHRAKQWREAEQEILLRLRTFVIASVIRIRVSLGYLGFPGAGILSASNYSTEYPKFRELVEELKSTEKIKSLDIGHWTYLTKNLQEIQRESDMLVTLFGDKLQATQYKSLLDVNSCASITALWCPMLVDSKEQSPDWWPVTTMLRDGIAEEFMNLLRAITELGDALV